MRLQSIQIKGFKSFADTNVINFSEDVIGIVGPNGCGKSNIVDAVRWVLGEQKTKQLRSEKMSNVIFNGTKKRKQGGKASVSLTFDNTRNILPTEYSTVTITRILYRSGESEYRLNDVPCRLKDITTLLMDTGMSSDSYAIIALGMVDDLLADRENSRRKLFEQAAGISKYKQRKREATRRLDHTTGDLDRVEDLLYEIDANLKSLERQAKRTRKHSAFKAKYKELGIELATYQLADFREDFKRIKGRVSEQEESLITLTAQLDTAEAKLEQDKKSTLDQEQALSGEQRKLNALTAQIRTAEGDKKSAEQKADFLLQNAGTLERRIATTTDRIAQLEKDYAHYRQQIESEQEISAAQQTTLDTLKAELEQVRTAHAEQKTTLDRYLTEQQALERDRFELEKQKAISTSRADNLTRDIAREQQQITDRRAAADRQQTELAELETNTEAAQTRLTDLETTEQTRRDQLAEAEAEREKHTEQLAKVNRKLDALRNEYKLIKSLVDSMEGYSESIKYLSKKQQFGAPLLSDLIYCEPEYRVAVENYLDPYLSYYVVPDAERAQSAIRMLSQASKGKANFFLLDGIDAPAATPTAPEGLTAALSVVTVAEEYRPLLAWLLQGVYLADSERVWAGVEYADQTLVAADGSVVRRQRSLSGGSVGLFEGKKIGRKKNLEALSTQIDTLTSERDQLKEQLGQVQHSIKTLRQQDATRDIKQAQQALARLHQQTAQSRARMEGYQSYEADARERIAQAEAQQAALSQSLHELSGRISEKQAEIDVYLKQVPAADESFKAAAEALSKASQAYNEQHITTIRQQNKLESLGRERDFRQQQLTEAQQQLAQDRQKAFTATDERGDLLTQIDELERKLQEQYDIRRAQQQRLTEVEQAYYKGRGHINEQEEAVRRLNKQRQEGQYLLQELKDKFNAIKLDITSISERIKVEFGLDVNEVIQRDLHPDYTREGLEAETARLRKKLDNYGDINPMAVEAYDEMKERHESITQQRDDILEAKNSLLETIKEIEHTATEQFMAAFTQVREHFQRVFRSLFSDSDSCDLFLEDPENPLESNINITAKPKGKRPLTINQLSGGEKTLTATALLFSLYLLKPAPFCIFDEVDAPLDDANIGKFNKIIREFSQDSQFIIVTHNKQTMAAVDVIYGVTMQEQGVSTVTPVDVRMYQG